MKEQTYCTSTIFLANETTIDLTTSDDGTSVIHIAQYPVNFSIFAEDEADLRRLYDVIGTRLSGIRLREAA